MTVRDIKELSRSMSAILSDSQGLNLHAQAHARSILHQLETPHDDWPSFRKDIDERLMYSANIMISHGIDLCGDEEHKELAEQLIIRGAEALEFICELGKVKASVPDELVKAAVAYHIVGHHARSYVIMQRLENKYKEGEKFTEVIKALMKKDLGLARKQTFEIFDLPVFDDNSVAEALSDGDISDDDAIANLGRRSIVESISMYLEYLKDGKNHLLENAISICRDVADLGRDSHHVDLWWWGRAIEKLLEEVGNSSLWSSLKDMCTQRSNGGPIQRYIEGHITRKTAITTLWPSQRKSLDLIKHPDTPSFCVRMPTSSGKTKIAELAIVKAVLDQLPDNDTKCIYIAPFRSLAVEVEATLREGLKPLGIRVSEIYGGFDVSAAEKRLIQDTHVLIATPEKLDAVIRLAPDLLNAVRLVIVDEGHLAGDISERGIRTEFLINRLLYKLGRDECRYIFISAVLPNPDDFAEWIAGDASNVISSNWRPSRMVLGLCLWNRTRIRLEYSHHGTEKLEQEVFVPQFLRTKKIRGLEGVGQRRNPFPHDVREAFAASAIRFTQYGSTLAFVPQARQVQSTAKMILKSLKMMKAIAQANGQDLQFPKPDESSALMQACMTAIKDELGDDAEILAFLKAGIVVHHGNLPTRVRLAVERLVRAGEIRLIVATTTLGQGVNLPIRTVLVRGLRYGRYSMVDALTFWNIAGRAGRAMRENEGQILFFIDETQSSREVRIQRKNALELIERSGVKAVIGLLHRALSYLRNIWKRHAPDIDFSTLCLKLAEDDFNWSDEDNRANLQYIFQLIDQHLLAVAVEADFTPNQADRLQEVLRESLLFTQLEAHPIPDIDVTAAEAILTTRLSRVFRKIPQENQRKRFYRMGFSLDDCTKVEELEDGLIELIVNSKEWENITTGEQMDILLSLTDKALMLDTITSIEESLPIDLREIIRAWLSGQRCIEMIANGLAVDFEGDVGRLSRFLERICVYGLSWVINGFISYIREHFEEDESELPAVAEFFPTMFKIGVNNPLAAVFAPYLQLDRRLALMLAEACPHALAAMNKAIAWLNNVSEEELKQLGFESEDIERVIFCQREASAGMFFRDTAIKETRTISTSSKFAEALRPGETILFRARLDIGRKSYDLYTVTGGFLGSYTSHMGDLPDWIREPHHIHTTIKKIKRVDLKTKRIKFETRQLTKS